MGISGGEIFLIVLVVLMLFGADKLPELVRSFGKGMHEVKKATDEIKREISGNVEDIRSEVLDVKQYIEEEIHSANVETVDGIKGYEPYEQALHESEQVSSEVEQPPLNNRSQVIGDENGNNEYTSDYII